MTFRLWRCFMIAAPCSLDLLLSAFMNCPSRTIGAYVKQIICSSEYLRFDWNWGNPVIDRKPPHESQKGLKTEDISPSRGSTLVTYYSLSPFYISDLGNHINCASWRISSLFFRSWLLLLLGCYMSIVLNATNVIMQNTFICCCKLYFSDSKIMYLVSCIHLVFVFSYSCLFVSTLRGHLSNYIAPFPSHKCNMCIFIHKITLKQGTCVDQHFVWYH